jgi:predicted small lipoprotein YifL
MMKIEKMFLSMVAVSLLFLLAGCGGKTTHIPYVSPAPPEKNCTLKIGSTLEVQRFDGRAVNFSTEVKIPEGSHTFVVSYHKEWGDRMRGGMALDSSSRQVKYDHFIAGHIYELVGVSEVDSDNGLTEIWNLTTRSITRKPVAIRVGIRDVTNNQDGKIEWL